MTFSQVTDLASFLAIESEMDDLLAQCSGKLLYMTFDYLISWLTTVGSGKKFKILLDRDGRELVGVCPLVDQSTDEECRRGKTTMTFAGSGLWGYVDILCRDDKKETVLPRFMDELLSGNHADFLELGPFIANSATVHIIETYLNSRSVPFTKFPLSGAPFIDTAIGFDNYKKTLASRKSVTSDIARCARRLAELGRISICRVPHRVSRVQFEHHLTGFLDLYMKQWPVNRFRRNPLFGGLYSEFGFRASQKGFLDFTFLLLNEQPIAYHFGCIHKNCLYYFTPTFDVEYRRYSPGKILLWNLIEKSFESGVEFDFQNDIEPYKLQWTQTVHERVILRIPSSFEGTLNLRLKQSSSAMRRTLSKIRRMAERAKDRFVGT